MPTSHELIEEVLRLIVGSTIDAIFRVFWEREERIDQEEGPLELHLFDGLIVHFTGEADGSTMRVARGPWPDPFAPPRTSKEDEYLEVAGRWSRVLVSGEPNYRRFIGQTIERIDLLEDEDAVVGVAMHTGDGALCFVVRGDEDHVCWKAPRGLRASVLPLGVARE